MVTNSAWTQKYQSAAIFWEWLWCGGGCLIWGAGVAVAVLIWHAIELVCSGMALYGMLVWRWLPHMGWCCGGDCLNMACYWVIMSGYGPIWDPGAAVAPLHGMLVWRWQPNMGCLFGSGCSNMACYWVILCWYGPICDAGVAVAPLHGMLVWR